MAHWRGIPGWHVEIETSAGAEARWPAPSRQGARRRPAVRVTTDGVYTEFFDPDVFVSRERITGDPGIDPDVPLELRVEFTKMGRDGTLVRIIQGPYEPDVAGWHGEGWEKELTGSRTISPAAGAGGHAMTDGQQRPTCSTRRRADRSR